MLEKTPPIDAAAKSENVIEIVFAKKIGIVLSEIKVEVVETLEITRTMVTVDDSRPPRRENRLARGNLRVIRSPPR